MNYEVLIGYVKKFEFIDAIAKDLLSPHPTEGSLYRVLKTTENGPAYQLYLGRETNRAKMDTIILGSDLKGAYFDKWVYDVELVDEESYLKYDFSAEELAKLKGWIDSNNEDLHTLLTKYPMPKGVNLATGEATLSETSSPISEILERIKNSEDTYNTAMEDLSSSLNSIVSRDKDMAVTISSLMKYLATYTRAMKARPSCAFLLESKDPRAALFQSIRCIEDYCKFDQDPDNLMEAIFFCLLELQRKNIKDE